jgi:hypothetical protein
MQDQRFDPIVSMEHVCDQYERALREPDDLTEVMFGLEAAAVSLEALTEPMDRQAETFYMLAVNANLGTLGIQRKGTVSLEGLKDTIREIFAAIVAAGKKLLEMIVNFFNGLKAHIATLIRKAGQLRDRIIGHSTSRELTVSKEDSEQGLVIPEALARALAVGETVPNLSDLTKVVSDAIRSLIDFQAPDFSDTINHFLGDKWDTGKMLGQVGQDIQRLVVNFDMPRPGVFSKHSIEGGKVIYKTGVYPGNHAYELEHDQITTEGGEAAILSLTRLASSITAKVVSTGGDGTPSFKIDAPHEWSQAESTLAAVTKSLTQADKLHDVFIADFHKSMKFTADMQSRLSDSDATSLAQAKLYGGIAALSRKIYPPTIMFIGHLVSIQRYTINLLELVVEYTEKHKVQMPAA